MILNPAVASIQCCLFSLQCVVCGVQRLTRRVHCTVHCTLYSTLYTVLFVLFCVQYPWGVTSGAGVCTED